MVDGQGEVYTDFMDIWYACKDDPGVLLKELQSRFPLDKRIFRKSKWTFTETVLVFYGISPFELLELHTGITGLLDPYISILIKLIDKERIYDLLWDAEYSHSEACLGNDRFRVDEFFSFLREKKITIPEYLCCFSEDMSAQDSIETLQDEDKAISLDELDEKIFSLRRSSLRNLILKCFARVIWLGEEEKGKTNATRPKTVAASKEMTTVNDVLNSVMEESSTINPSLISKFYPGKKPGPKTKERKNKTELVKKAR